MSLGQWEEFTFQGIALHEVTVVLGGEEARPEAPQNCFQVSVVDIEGHRRAMSSCVCHGL